MIWFNMSRQAQLPPRCPFQKNPISRTTSHPLSTTTPCKDDKAYPRHHKSASQSFILDEQPSWLDDLLSDSESTSKGMMHLRSASDSTTGLDFIDSFPTHKGEENTVEDDTRNGLNLESDCLYGPNSPRRKRNLSFSENAIVTALSDYGTQSPPKFADRTFLIHETSFSDSRPDGLGLASDICADAREAKRHSGQRSRVRKLQYIAELERTVHVLEGLGSELTVRVVSLAQQRAALSIKNSNLKHQVVKLQLKKLAVEGEYQHLKKEVERLKSGLANFSKSTVVPTYHVASIPAVDDIRPKNTWQMLDMGKLNIH